MLALNSTTCNWLPPSYSRLPTVYCRPLTTYYQVWRTACSTAHSSRSGRHAGTGATRWCIGHLLLLLLYYDSPLRLATRYDTIVEGVGIDRVTANLEQAQIDSAYRVTDGEAKAMAKHLLAQEGLFVGGSAALNCVGAVRAARQLGPGHMIVTVLCDGGHRYLSTIHAPES